jgi:hypothetical protein
VDETRDRSIQFIVAGFVITALGSLVEFVNLWSNDALLQNSQYDVSYVAFLLAPFAAIGGWWYLSQLRVDEESQRVIIRRGFYFFALELILGSVGTTVSLIAESAGIISLRYLIPNWASAVGGAVAAVGFLLRARRLGNTGDVESTVDANDDDLLAR